MKRKRIEDRHLLDQVKAEDCMACRNYPCDPAHVRSKGAGGPDTLWNVIPLCRSCHHFQHQLGWKVFFDRWPLLWVFMQSIGWYWLDDKLWNDKLSKEAYENQ
jgi:hypothetical protein